MRRGSEFVPDQTVEGKLDNITCITVDDRSLVVAIAVTDSIREGNYCTVRGGGGWLPDRLVPQPSSCDDYYHHQ